MELNHRSPNISPSDHPNPTRDTKDTHSNIENVESNATHVLFSANTFLGSPLECSNARILDFVQVLHTLGDIDQQVRASRIRTEAPDLSGIGDVPSVLVSENTGSDLEIVTSADLAGFDITSGLFLEREGDGVETVVLVLRFGEGGHGGGGLDGLTVTDDRVGLLEGDTGVVFLEILKYGTENPVIIKRRTRISRKRTAKIHKP